MTTTIQVDEETNEMIESAKTNSRYHLTKGDIVKKALEQELDEDDRIVDYEKEASQLRQERNTLERKVEELSAAISVLQAGPFAGAVAGESHDDIVDGRLEMAGGNGLGRYDADLNWTDFEESFDEEDPLRDLEIEGLDEFKRLIEELEEREDGGIEPAIHYEFNITGRSKKLFDARSEHSSNLEGDIAFDRKSLYSFLYVITQYSTYDVNADTISARMVFPQNCEHEELIKDINTHERLEGDFDDTIRYECCECLTRRKKEHFLEIVNMDEEEAENRVIKEKVR